MAYQAVPALRREKMSAVDTAWLRMDCDGNLMMIVAVLMFDRPVDQQRLRTVMEARFLSHRRFRSRVVTDAVGGAWWQEQEVDFDRHIVRVRLATEDGGDKPALERLVGELSATPLDPSCPLWQMHFVDGCVGDDGAVRQAAIVRIHHCIADGIALVGVLLSMFDRSPIAQAAPDVREPVALDDDNPWQQIMQPVTDATITAINLSTTMWAKTMWMFA